MPRALNTIHNKIKRSTCRSTCKNPTEGGQMQIHNHHHTNIYIPDPQMMIARQSGSTASLSKHSFSSLKNAKLIALALSGLLIATCVFLFHFVISLHTHTTPGGHDLMGAVESRITRRYAVDRIVELTVDRTLFIVSFLSSRRTRKWPDYVPTKPSVQISLLLCGKVQQ